MNCEKNTFFLNTLYLALRPVPIIMQMVLSALHQDCSNTFYNLHFKFVEALYLCISITRAPRGLKDAHQPSSMSYRKKETGIGNVIKNRKSIRETFFETVRKNLQIAREIND